MVAVEEVPSEAVRSSTSTRGSSNDGAQQEKHTQGLEKMRSVGIWI